MNLEQFLKTFKDLAKADEPSLQDALRVLRSTHPRHADTIARTIYGDSVIPSMGNKKAYNDFMSRPRKGVFLHADLSDFGALNKLGSKGYSTGDEAIKKFGDIATKLSREHRGKAHHLSGDEFRFHFEKPEQAMGFAHKLKSALENTPKIDNKFNLAAAMGMGANPEHAEKSLVEAKGMLGPMVGGKRQNKHAVGETPTTIHDQYARDLMTAPKDMVNPLGESKTAPKATASTPVAPKANAVT